MRKEKVIMEVNPCLYELNTQIKVLKVTDGDTFHVQIPGKERWVERVRLIGVDTPEKGQTIWGHRAALFTEKILMGHNIYLETDTKKRDQYERLLVYAWAKRNKVLVMLNELLVSAGLAVVFTVEPNIKYAKHFQKACRYAQKRQLGFWGYQGHFINPHAYRNNN